MLELSVLTFAFLKVLVAMKVIAICALFLALALADQRPIYEFEEWWAIRSFKPTPLIQSRFRGSRIVGGQEAARNQFPYQAGLRLNIPGNANQGTCGGSLVSTTRVITAAHCIDIVSSVDVVLGAHFLNQPEGTQVRQNVGTSGLIWHDEYNPQTIENDVAIIILNSPVTLNSVIQPVNLPSGADLANDFAGELAVASGWGRFSSENVASEFLRFVEVNVMSNTLCRIRFPTLIQPTTSNFALNVLILYKIIIIFVSFLHTVCTSGSNDSGTGVGACSGDSGGPLTVQRDGQSTMIGIASFALTTNCEAGWPTGFARVTSFVPWFNARM